MATPICCSPARQAVCLAIRRLRASPGMRIAISIAVMAITTIISISVNPRRFLTPRSPRDGLAPGFPSSRS